MHGSEYFPPNYLCVPMAYKRIQIYMKRLGHDANRIFIEGFSNTVSSYTTKMLKGVMEYNNLWTKTFHSCLLEFEGLKPDERGDYTAKLSRKDMPHWPKGEEEDDDATTQSDDEDLEDDDDEVETMVRIMPAHARKSRLNRVPPIRICLWYNPLMHIPASLSRMEWEHQLGGFPAFFIYSMSRGIYSSSTNPLLKPQYFMPEARLMTMHERWCSYMDDAGNPLAGFCIAGWARKQYCRVAEACRSTLGVSTVEKVQMFKDYLQTCFNMHLGLIDTKSLRSKTIYWAHKLMKVRVCLSLSLSPTLQDAHTFDDCVFNRRWTTHSTMTWCRSSRTSSSSAQTGSWAPGGRRTSRSTAAQGTGPSQMGGMRRCRSSTLSRSTS